MVLASLLVCQNQMAPYLNGRTWKAEALPGSIHTKQRKTYTTCIVVRHHRGWSGLMACCFILVCFVLTLPDAHAQFVGWVKKTTLPPLRGSLGACVIGQKLYTVGGVIPYAWTDLAANEVYGLTTWEAKAPIPTARGWLSVAVVSDTGYAIGGSYPNATSKVEAYAL
jgi:hypothetical protein